MAAAVREKARRASAYVKQLVSPPKSYDVPELDLEHHGSDYPAHIHVKRVGRYEPQLSKAQQNLAQYGPRRLLIVAYDELLDPNGQCTGFVCPQGWDSGVTYRRHEDPTIATYYRLQNWEHEMQEQQRTTFRSLCMYGGVKSVKVVTDLGDLEGKEFAVETDVAEEASAKFKFLKKSEDSLLFEWNMEGLAPMPPHPRVAPSVNLFMVDRDPAHRGTDDERSAKNLLHQVISQSEKAKPPRPVVRNLLVRLKHRRVRTTSGEGSVGVSHVNVSASGEVSREHFEEVVLFVQFHEPEVYEDMNPKFKPAEKYFPDVIGKIEDLASECLQEFSSEKAAEDCVQSLSCFAPYSVYFLILGEVATGKSTFVHNIVRALHGALDPIDPVNRTEPKGIKIRGQKSALGSEHDLGDGTERTHRLTVLNGIGRKSRGELVFIDTVGLVTDEVQAARDYQRMVNGRDGEGRAEPLVVFIAFDAAKLFKNLPAEGTTGPTNKAKLDLTAYRPVAEQTKRPVVVLLTKVDLLTTALALSMAEAEAAYNRLKALVEAVFTTTILGVEAVANMTVPTKEELESHVELLAEASRKKSQEEEYRQWERAQQAKHDEVLKRFQRMLQLPFSDRARRGDGLEAPLLNEH